LNRRTLLRYGGFVFSVGGAKVAGVAISSLTFPFLVRHLGVEMYGLWNYVVAIGVFLETVANPGLTVFLTQQLAARRENAFELVSDVLVLRILSACVAIGVSWVVSSFEVRPEIRELMRVYLIGVFVVNLLGSDFLLGALEMFHSRSILAVLQQTMFAAGIFALVWKPTDVIWLPICVIGSSAITSIAGWFILWRQGLRLRLVFQPRHWKAILVPSAHYAISSLMSSFYQRTGHLVVRWFLGDFALGIYAAAVRLLDLLRSLVIVIISVLMPRIAIAGRTGAGLARLTKVSVTIIAVVSIPLTAGLISTANVLVPWLLGPKYIEDISLLRWMSAYIVGASAASLFAGTILYAMGKHRAYLISTTAGAVSGVILYATLTPTIGLKGAGLALVLGELCVVLAAYHFLPAELHACWKSPAVAQSLVAGLIMIVAVRVVEFYHADALLVISTGAAVYLLTCFWLMRKSVAEEFRTAQLSVTD